MRLLIPIIGGLLLMSIPKSLKKSTSQKGIDLVKFLEGENLTVYLDPVNIPTVGVGHKVLPNTFKIGDVISQAQSDKLLRKDLNKAEKTINTAVNVPLNQNQFDALVSFVFNVGEDNFKRSTLLNRLNDYDYQGAMAEMSRWKYATDKQSGKKEELPGLINRRYYEQNLFNA